MGLIRLGLIGLCLLQLAACSSAWNATKKTAQVLWDPSIPVGEAKDLPTQLTYSMYALDKVNPNAAGDATPLELVVYELEDDSKFLAADFDSLKADYKEALGSNYIDHSDYTLLPGQFKFIDHFAVDEDTRYIGIMAHFNDPEVAQWKKVVKIKPMGREYHLLMFFSEQDIVLDKVE